MKHFAEKQELSLRSIVFSRDGNRIATSSYDGTTRVWDTETGVAILTASDPAWSATLLNGVGLAPDGKSLVTGFKRDGAWHARIWNVDSQTCPVELEGQCLAPAFTPDSAHLAGARGTQLVIWDARTGKVQAAHDIGHQLTQRPVFSADGTRMAAAFLHNVCLWDTADFRKLCYWRGHTENIRRLAFSPDAQRLTTVSVDGVCRVWDAETCRELLALGEQRASAGGIGMSPDGRLLATCSHIGRRVLLYDSFPPDITPEQIDEWHIERYLAWRKEHVDGDKTPSGEDSQDRAPR